MNRCAFGLLIVLIASGMARAEGKIDADLEKIQGTWVLTGVEINGNLIPAPEGGGTFIFGKDRKLVMKEKGQKDREGTYRMDAGKDPRELDLMAAKEVLRGIYQLDGDTLKVAYSIKGPDGKRPTVLDSGKVPIMILKRQKP